MRSLSCVAYHYHHPYFRDLLKIDVACTDIVAPAIESCSDEAMNIIKVLNFSF